MNGRRRRELTAHLQSIGALDRVDMRALSDALRDTGLSVCRAGLVADLKEALADLYSGTVTRGGWPVEGRDACLRRVEGLLSGAGVDQ